VRKGGIVLTRCQTMGQKWEASGENHNKKDTFGQARVEKNPASDEDGEGRIGA